MQIGEFTNELLHMMSEKPVLCELALCASGDIFPSSSLPYPDSAEAGSAEGGGGSVAVAVRQAELMPRGLEVFQSDSSGGRPRNATEVDRDLAEKLVGAVAIIIPYGDFEDTMEEVRGTNARVHKRLAPDGIASVEHGFGAPLRPLTAAPQFRSRREKEGRKEKMQQISYRSKF